MIRTHRKFRDDAGSDDARATPRAASNANEVAAEILEGLAERLRNSRGSAKRIAGYLKAADAIRRSSYSIEDLWNRGDGHALTAIPGVTATIGQVLTELITSKRIPIGSGRRQGK